MYNTIYTSFCACAYTLRQSEIISPAHMTCMQRLYHALATSQNLTQRHTIWKLFQKKTAPPGGRQLITCHHLSRKYGYETTPRISATQLLPTSPEL